ncbi:MAG TPA: glycosyltransferase family 2 protein [Candidatus Saccharimonadales bacterium]|nr:glycosyltransferase family 2 protein [Candidatus Saccharimonadales bacterium]
MNRVAVVVLNYKGIEDTINCLKSLEKQTFKHFKIVAVENGSGDTSVAEFKKLEAKYGQKLQALYNQENLGFTGGVNTGIRWALDHGFDGIALFNNDAIAEPTWLEELVKAQKIKKSGITTGLLLHEHGDTIDSTGDWYSTWGLPFPRNRGDNASNAPAAEFVFSATGGGSLYTAELFKNIGLFDDVLFAYYEDVDISFRAQLAGYSVWYTPAAIAYHKQGATSNRMPSGFAVRQTFKNLPVVFIKDVPRQLLFSIGVRFYFAYTLMLGNAIKNGNGSAALRGMIQSIGLIPHSFRERWRIQKNKKVSALHIRQLLWPDLPPDQTGIRRLRRFFTGKA